MKCCSGKASISVTILLSLVGPKRAPAQLCVPDLTADANGDCVVDPLDSGAVYPEFTRRGGRRVLSRFGCAVGTGDTSCDATDANADGVVDPLDAGFVLSRLGPCE